MSKNAEYAARYRSKRRLQIKEFLGSRCAICGSDHDLEVDHINPNQKSFTISNRLQIRWELMQAELEKCQLLCKPCHLAKTAAEQTGRVPHNKGKWVHGSITGYQKGCRCLDCKEVQAAYKKKLRSRMVAGEDKRNELLTRRPGNGPVGSNPTPSATEGPTWESQAASKAVGCNSLAGSSPAPSSKERA